MILPIMNGIYIVVAICAFSIFILRNMDPMANYPDHPHYDLKTFLMLINSVAFIYLLAWLIGVYGNFVISILL